MTSNNKLNESMMQRHVSQRQMLEAALELQLQWSANNAACRVPLQASSSRRSEVIRILSEALALLESDHDTMDRDLQ